LLHFADSLMNKIFSSWLRGPETQTFYELKKKTIIGTN